MSQTQSKQASTTGALWEAVGGRSVEETLATMKAEGWSQESSVEGELRRVVMVRDSKRATLYIAHGKVGMVNVQ